MTASLTPTLRRALIMAGGTGGHVYPALAVADGLRQQGWHVDWVGTERGLESQVVPAHNFSLHVLPVRGLRGKGIIFRLTSVVQLLRSLVSALGLVRRLRPDVVLGMGGYAAGPAGVAAWVLRRPLVIHEQNAVAGTTNRWLAPLAKQVLCGLSGAFEQRDNGHLVGNPIRDDIVSLFASSREFPAAFTSERPLRLVVLGGSLGSMPLNTAVPAALAELGEAYKQRLRVVHQCGGPHVDATRQAYSLAADIDVAIQPFVDDMAAIYQSADLVICRAGALTVAELAVAGVPAILVPLPHAIDDHQTRNAQSLSEHGAAELLPQREITPKLLGSLVQRHIDAPASLQVMSDRARDRAMPQATASVIQVMEAVAHAA